ncbi:MAG TPA: O-antigen ligase family protein [Terracidiphilus sp.]
MRRIALALLILFIFTIPWEYSLVLPAPFGNVARMAGLLALAAAIPAVLHTGHLRTPAVLHWLVLAFYLWWCCTCFWTIDTTATLTRLRGDFQEMMIVWLLWEFTEDAVGLLAVLRAWVAGTGVLALLTLADFAWASAIGAYQVRFVAAGQDPNDVARFIDLGLPIAALLFRCEQRAVVRWAALALLPACLTAVLLTASRGGFLAAAVALAGCAIILGRGQAKTFAAGILALPAVLAGIWLVIPSGTLDRLATIPAELARGDLNQRINIWQAGWTAFVHSPILGTGAGTFVNAAHTSEIDTAHNTLLSIAVSGGLCAVFLAAAVVVAVVRLLPELHGLLRIALSTVLAVCALSSLVATVEESRTTWLLLGVVAVSARLASKRTHELETCFEPACSIEGNAAGATVIPAPQ